MRHIKSMLFIAVSERDCTWELSAPSEHRAQLACGGFCLTCARQSHNWLDFQRVPEVIFIDAALSLSARPTLFPFCFMPAHAVQCFHFWAWEIAARVAGLCCRDSCWSWGTSLVLLPSQKRDHKRILTTYTLPQSTAKAWKLPTLRIIHTQWKH